MSSASRAPGLPFDADRQSEHDARAAAFDADNPHVFDRLRALALQLRRSGVARGSIKLLFERLRWDHYVETRGDRYLLNNSWAPWYARELMRRCPELAGWFETRASAFDPDYHDRPIRGAGRRAS